MTITRTPKVIAEGQLPSAKGTLYTAPGATSAYISLISLVNTGGSVQSVVIYGNFSGTSRILFSVDNLAQYERIEFQAGLILETGDLIEGVTTTATQVDYIITGVQEA